MAVVIAITIRTCAKDLGFVLGLTGRLDEAEGELRASAMRRSRPYTRP